MSVVRLRPASVARCLLLLGAAAVLAGCQKEEEITHYKVPKAEAPPLPAVPSAKSTQRLLGAIIPRGDELWVIKLMGPEAAVKGHEDEFQAFLDSVQFKDGDKSPTYKAPESWRPSKGTQFSVSAFKVGPDEAAPELTVTPSRGSVADNVKRWRGQLGLKSSTDDDIKRTTKEKKIGDVTAVVVDLTGTGSGTMGRPPFAGMSHPPIAPVAGAAPVASAAPARLKYTLPANWTEGGELERAGIRREAVFQVSDGGRSAEVTATIAGGSVKDNIDRWRGQIGLAPLTDDEFNNQRTLLIGGSPGIFVDLAGDGRGDHQAILGAVVPRGREQWFFKMTGPADVVGRQKSAFEAFLKSVRFEGGTANE
jgi:hypothetical protein